MKRFLSTLAMLVLVSQSVVTSLAYAQEANSSGEVDSSATMEIAAVEPSSNESNDNLPSVEVSTLEVETSTVDTSTVDTQLTEESNEIFEDLGFEESLNLWLQTLPLKLLTAKEPGETDFDKFVKKWKTAESCKPEGKKSWCVNNPKQSSVNIEPSETLEEGQVWMWKLVQATNNPWEYEISIAVRWKNKTEVEEVQNNVCAVVVFDKSFSMWDECNSRTCDTRYYGYGYNYWEKRYNAVNWAISFSKSLRDTNSNAYIWLITFAKSATQSRWLQKEVLTSNDFGNLDASTNIHAWLIEAKKMLNSNKCSDAKKYIVLISDGEPNYYVNNWENQQCWNECGNITVEYASTLKSDIEIFSIWYDTNSTADLILQWIASTDKDTDTIKHFFQWDTSNVADAFDNIATLVNSAFAWTKAKVTDELWENMTLSEWKTLSDFWNITEEWYVYTFKVRVNPEIEWDQNDLANTE